MTKLPGRKQGLRTLNALSGLLRPSDIRHRVSASFTPVPQAFRRPTRFMFMTLVVTVLAGCQPGQVTIPPHQSQWLSRKGVGSIDETNAYYTTIDPTSAKDTFDKWKNANGFGSGTEFRTVYFNGGDLELGRDMHCKRVGSFDIACYVTNYGPPPYDIAKMMPNPAWPDPTQALADAVAAATNQPGNPPFATVAMEFTPHSLFFLQPNNVRFYVFSQPDGKRQPYAALDTEGLKFVPQMCMACHGGQYNPIKGGGSGATGASFLPFDIFTFQYSQTSPFTLSDQQEKFRLLNALVEETTPNPTNPNQPIQSLIDDWYKSCGGVTAANCTPTDYTNQNPPPGWAGSGPDGLNAYFGTVRYYCQTCHIAEGAEIDWRTYEQFKKRAGPISDSVTIAYHVCNSNSHDMPHAEVPYENFWNNILAKTTLSLFMQSQGIANCP
jgi:hypothetical protein